MNPANVTEAVPPNAQRSPRPLATRAAVRPRGTGTLASIRELWRFNEVLEELVKRDLKVRYKRSVLGIFWTMLNPLLMMVITTIVFFNLFRSAIVNFPIYVL